MTTMVVARLFDHHHQGCHKSVRHRMRVGDLELCRLGGAPLAPGVHASLPVSAGLDPGHAHVVPTGCSLPHPGHSSGGVSGAS